MSSVWLHHHIIGHHVIIVLCFDQSLTKSRLPSLAANEEYYQLLMINDSQPSGLDVSSYTIEDIDSITSEYTLKNNVSYWIMFKIIQIFQFIYCSMHLQLSNIFTEVNKNTYTWQYLRFVIHPTVILPLHLSLQQDIFAVAVSLITGRIVYISDQAASILNCKREVFKDRKFVEFLTPQDVSVFYSFTTPYRLPSWSMCTGAGTEQLHRCFKPL